MHLSNICFVCSRRSNSCCLLLFVLMTVRGKQDAVNSTRAKFLHPEGDQLTWLAVMKAFLAVDKKKRAEWASDNFINVRCVRLRN